jgi:hypothetical protein
VTAIPNKTQHPNNTNNSNNNKTITINIQHIHYLTMNILCDDTACLSALLPACATATATATATTVHQLSIIYIGDGFLLLYAMPCHAMPCHAMRETKATSNSNEQQPQKQKQKRTLVNVSSNMIHEIQTVLEKISFNIILLY